MTNTHNKLFTNSRCHCTAFRLGTVWVDSWGYTQRSHITQYRLNLLASLLPVSQENHAFSVSLVSPNMTIMNITKHCQFLTTSPVGKYITCMTLFQTQMSLDIDSNCQNSHKKLTVYVLLTPNAVDYKMHKIWQQSMILFHKWHVDIMPDNCN